MQQMGHFSAIMSFPLRMHNFGGCGEGGFSSVIRGKKEARGARRSYESSEHELFFPLRVKTPHHLLNLLFSNDPLKAL